jgi:hypothetical protein
MNRSSHCSCATCAEAEINNLIISLPDVVFAPPAFTFDDMLKVAGEAWGQLGINTVRKWKVYNEQYFGGALRPIPLIITQTMPFGGRIGLCSHGTGSRSITINIPSEHNFLVGDNDTLLHEMVHQCLNERGENPKHARDAEPLQPLH